MDSTKRVVTIPGKSYRFNRSDYRFETPLRQGVFGGEKWPPSCSWCGRDLKTSSLVRQIVSADLTVQMDAPICPICFNYLNLTVAYSKARAGTIIAAGAAAGVWIMAIFMVFGVSEGGGHEVDDAQAIGGLGLFGPLLLWLLSLFLTTALAWLMGRRTRRYGRELRDLQEMVPKTPVVHLGRSKSKGNSVLLLARDDAYARSCVKFYARLQLPADLAAMSYEDLLTRLQSCRADLSGWKDRDGEQLLEQYRAQAKFIGEELYRRGGMSLLHKAYDDSHSDRAIEIAWDGIGEWRG